MPYVSRDGVKIFYESFGDGPPVVFLHPWSTNRYVWANQIPVFARDHRCIVMDHRGHGQSDKPAAGYGIDQMAADVVAVLDDAGIDQAVLVGNSIGGMVAMQTALDAPGRVKGLLILSSGTNFGATADEETAKAMQADWRAFFSALLDAALSEKSKAMRPEISEFMEGCFRTESNFTEGVFFASVQDPNGLFAWDISDRLKDIKVPTLIVAGTEDGATPVAMNQFLADEIPGAELKVYPEIGHFSQLEQPMVFNMDLRGLLARAA